MLQPVLLIPIFVAWNNSFKIFFNSTLVILILDVYDREWIKGSVLFEEHVDLESDVVVGLAELAQDVEAELGGSRSRGLDAWNMDNNGAASVVVGVTGPRPPAFSILKIVFSEGNETIFTVMSAAT